MQLFQLVWSEVDLLTRWKGRWMVEDGEAQSRAPGASDNVRRGRWPAWTIKDHHCHLKYYYTDENTWIICWKDIYTKDILFKALKMKAIQHTAIKSNMMQEKTMYRSTSVQCYRNQTHNLCCVLVSSIPSFLLLKPRIPASTTSYFHSAHSTVP